MGWTPESSETDLEIFITNVGETALIEIYVLDDQKYEAWEDSELLPRVRLQLEKSYGVSQTGSVTLVLRNDDHRYTDSDAGSIFHGYQTVGNWVRIRSGWGANYSTALATQFQGKINKVEVTEDRRARITVYDPLRELMETVVDETDEDGLTINTSVVASMNPMEILEYLIKDKFAIQRWDMDSLSYGDLLDADSLTESVNRTGEIYINSTTWPNGSKLIDMVQDLMKISGGYIYAGKDGKLYTYIYAPSMTMPSTRSFNGNETVSGRNVIRAKYYKDTDGIINKVEWTYGQAGTKHVSPADTESMDIFGEKSISLSTKWEANTPDLDGAAYRLLARYADEIGLYDITAQWATDGQGLAVTLADIILLTDTALNCSSQKVQVISLETSLLEQMTRMVGEDPAVLDDKWGFACSDIDQGDGYGITSADWNNWKYRFFFFGYADLTDPHYGGANPGFDPDGNNNMVINPDFGVPDSWGNGLEELFIFW